jgi:hypothetical protein
MYACKVILDSLAPCNKRLTTLQLTYPRFVHSEVLTHRDRARNSGSSRAIPWPVMCEQIQTNAVVPIKWGKNQKGMQTGEEVDEATRQQAEAIWLGARDSALKAAQALHELGIHKSLCNRLTEPWMWITVVMTATEWNNFLRQRCHRDAEVHIQRIAYMIKEELERSKPVVAHRGYWHLPYIEEDDWRNVPVLAQLKNKFPFHMCPALPVLKAASVARCARVSFKPFNAENKDLADDVRLFQDLQTGSDGAIMHASPFEHVAEALADPVRSGPFVGWKQFRKEFDNENVEG